MTRRFLTVFLVAVLAVPAALALGCGDDNKPGDKAPALPSAETMTLDLSLFTGASAAPAAPETQANFNHAVVSVGVVSLVTAAILAPPEFAFALAAHTVPTRQEDGSWMWIYTGTYQGKDWQFRLNGKRVSDGVDWRMDAQLPGESAGLWFRGHTESDGNSGQWILTDFTQEGNPDVLQIDWLHNSAQDAFLDITLIDTENDFYSSTVTYQVSGTDYSLFFSNASTVETLEVLWNGDTHAGSIRAPGFNGGERACWDADLQDVTCPAAAPVLRRGPR